MVEVCKICGEKKELSRRGICWDCMSMVFELQDYIVNSIQHYIRKINVPTPISPKKLGLNPLSPNIFVIRTWNTPRKLKSPVSPLYRKYRIIYDAEDDCFKLQKLISTGIHEYATEPDAQSWFTIKTIPRNELPITFKKYKDKIDFVREQYKKFRKSMEDYEKARNRFQEIFGRARELQKSLIERIPELLRKKGIEEAKKEVDVLIKRLIG